MNDISQYIGVVYVVETGEIRAVINPDYDEQLEDKNHTTSNNVNETLKMIKLKRKSKYIEFENPMSAGDCAIATKIAERVINDTNISS